MLLTAINYQNNMSFGPDLPAGDPVHRRHSPHVCQPVRVDDPRCGRPRCFRPAQRISVQLERVASGEHFALLLKWPDSSASTVNLVERGYVQVHLHMAVGGRGWFSPGRLLLESTYPLGLLRCWTWVDLDLCAGVSAAAGLS